MTKRLVQSGYTLVEIAVVLSIVAVLLGSVVLGGQALIKEGDKKAFVGQVASIRSAVALFRDRYHFLPGDFPVTNDIPNVSDACKKGNGDGLISADESACVLEHLVSANLAQPNLFSSKYSEIAVSVISKDGAVTAYGGSVSSTLLRADVHNVLLMQNTPCFLAKAVDEAFDDGDLTNVARPGKVASLNGTCSDDFDHVWLAVALW